MQTDNLKELRSLRIQEKAIKARIDEISDAATNEALALAPDGGEFNIPDVGKFQLQITECYDLADFRKYKEPTECYDLADFRKYKEPEAVKWRENAREKIKEQNLTKARTALMAGLVKTFVQLYPDKEPDELKMTVKVIE